MTRESLAIPLPIKMMWMKHPLDPHAEHTTNDEANASQYKQPTELKLEWLRIATDIIFIVQSVMKEVNETLRVMISQMIAECCRYFTDLTNKTDSQRKIL